ncbi:MULTISPECIES: hypothetical protein [Thermomonospora]|uniref:Uncharacterized protein n=1 Tax=Thermomonospora curvata (strain ATCC 19995 / DSM 43183 / JCM 3096 / KCTC 9072 / NBRC 15933 / NCIMB 10081 / Henssen B9) TaxID=471852 RepID=D1ACK7_THECD|nr:MULTISPECIES: hypothetical protein [Thermomonospora]ACY99266.1 hypothetical protein Tcur_3733 [Thermomonospora curvata DSM 43183]PKK12328.1 MAG: hypothetical protein BUE48_018310 [Thermomonospora sp. CIF 1]
MSVWSAHCALSRRFDVHRPPRRRPPGSGNVCPGSAGAGRTSLPGAGTARPLRGEWPEAPFAAPRHAPIRIMAGAVRWERPHDQERRRRRLIGEA